MVAVGFVTIVFFRWLAGWVRRWDELYRDHVVEGDLCGSACVIVFSKCDKPAQNPRKADTLISPLRVDRGDRMKHWGHCLGPSVFGDGFGWLKKGAASKVAFCVGIFQHGRLFVSAKIGCVESDGDALR